MAPLKLTESVNKGEKVVTSDKWQFNWQDAQAMGMNALWYSSPIILLILTAVQAGQSWDEIKLAVYGVILQNAIGFFKKLSTSQKYIVEK